MEKMLLKFGVAVPIIYFGTLLFAPLLYPGYSHRTQYASELGAAAAPYPYIFNLAIIACGLSAIAGCIGIALALQRQFGAKVTAALTGIALLLWGAAMTMGGLFPMPDERHGAFGLGIAVQIAPLFALLAIWKSDRPVWLKWFLAAVLVVSGALFAIMMGVGSLVHVADVGLWQRAYALASIAWIGVLAWALHANSTGATADIME